MVFFFFIVLRGYCVEIGLKSQESCTLAIIQGFECNSSLFYSVRSTLPMDLTSISNTNDQPKYPHTKALTPPRSKPNPTLPVFSPLNLQQSQHASSPLPHQLIFTHHPPLNHPPNFFHHLLIFFTPRPSNQLQH